MANVFDQFDAPAVNVFDALDAPKSDGAQPKTNVFDQFDVDAFQAAQPAFAASTSYLDTLARTPALKDDTFDLPVANQIDSEVTQTQADDRMATIPTISAAPTIGGEIESGNIGTAASMIYENVRRHFSGIMGPTSSERIENSVAVTAPDGSVSYQYKPAEQNRLYKEGLFSGFLDVHPMQHNPGDTTLEMTGKAIFNVAAGLESSILSPGGVATLGMGGPTAAVANTGFRLDMLANAKEQLQKAHDSTDNAEKIEGFLGGTISLFMAAHGIVPKAPDSTPTKSEIVQNINVVPDELLNEAAGGLKESSPAIAKAASDQLAMRAQDTAKEVEPILPKLEGPMQDKVRGIIEKQAAGEPLTQNEQATMIQVRSLASKVKGDQTNAEFTAPTSQPPGTTPPPTPEAAGETTGSPPAQGGRSSLFSQALAEQAPAAELDALHLERQRLADPFNHEPGWQEKLDHIDAILDSHDQTAVAESAHRTSQNLTPETAKALDETPKSDADTLESTGSMDTINGLARKYGVPEDVIDKGWNSMGQDWLREQIRQKMNPPTYDAARVDDYATRVPAWIGDAAKAVLVEGKSVEEAAGEAGQTVKNTQAAVDKAKAYLDTAKTVARTPSESPFGRDEVSTEARPDSPEIEQAKDWTSATGDVSEPARMKRGGGESGGLQLPKFADRTMSELDQATTERSAKLQKSFDEAERARKEIEKAIPSGRRRNAASVWMEADGDAAKLAAWEAGAKGKLFRDAARDAQTLTPEEIAIARKAKAAFDVLATRGQAHGVLKNQRDNYVPHLWDLDKKTSVGGGGKLQQSMKFAKARTFDNFAAGDAAGFTPKSLDIAKLLPTYITEMNKVVADRQFVADLASRTAEDGRPLVVPRGAVKGTVSPSGDYATMINPDAIKSLKDASGNKVDTTDYKVMPDQPALHDWNWEKSDLNGNPMFMRDDLAVHPDAAKRINAMLGRSGLKDIPGVAAVDKAQGIMKREMFGLLAPFHQVQEGTHAIGHWVNPFFGLETVDMRNPLMYDAARHGLMLLPDRQTASGYMEGVGGKGTFLTQALRFLGEKTDASGKGELVGKAATAMANVVDGYQNYLFHQYIPSLKFKTYEAMLRRNMGTYARELKAGTMTDSDVKLTTAEQSNAAYGHLNRDLLDRNPTTQHFMQLTMLAPDFLEARGRFVGQATKGLLGSKVGLEQFKAVAIMALVQAGVAYAISKLTSNPYDPKKPFSVTAGGREYTMRSVPEDLLRLGTDLKNQASGDGRGLPFIKARVNPLLASGWELLSGQNYRGEKTTGRQTIEEMLAKYIPITARSIPGIRSLTETSRQSPISPLEQLAGSFGLKISRASPITDTYGKASEWMKSQGIPKDTGTYPISKYQQLRYALEDGDMDKAKDELAKLKASGGTPAKLAQGFRESVNHPFTKSANMDLQFRNSLNPSDRAVFDLAKTKREQILQRFGSIR